MDNKYFCEICNKKYASNNSLWNHNKKFHTENLIKKEYECEHCAKGFNNISNKYRHLKSCKIKKKEDLELKLKQKELEIKEKLCNLEERKIILLEKKEERISESIKNNESVAPSLKTIKKLLDDKKNQIINSTVNSNNTININNTLNDNSKNVNYIVNFGQEKVCETLTMKEKKQILNSRFNCIEKLVEITNCGKYNQFKNIIITNLKDKLTYVYDEKKGNFITCDKKTSLDTLLNNRIMDIINVYDELSTANKIDDKTKKFIENFLNNINDETNQFTDENEEIIYPNLKKYKINKVKILLYDNHDNMTKDLALYLS